MKTKWIIGLAATTVLASCGGGQKEEEPEEQKDTVAVKDTVPEYKYKFSVTEEDVAPSWWVYIGDSTSIAGLGKFFEKK